MVSLYDSPTGPLPPKRKAKRKYGMRVDSKNKNGTTPPMEVLRARRTYVYHPTSYSTRTGEKVFSCCVLCFQCLNEHYQLFA